MLIARTLEYAPDAPTQWELYATELETERLDWRERANEGWAEAHPHLWLFRMYRTPAYDRIHELATRASPLLRAFHEHQDAAAKVFAEYELPWPLP